MAKSQKFPLTPFVDPLPLPRRLIAAEHGGELSVSIRSGAHSFHRDLPSSQVWGYEGTAPGPTIEVESGEQVRVRWRNELDGEFPVDVTIAPDEVDAEGVPVQCLPGLSGGTPDDNVSALSGYSVVHLHGGLTPAVYDGWTENLFAPGQDAYNTYPGKQRASMLWYHDHVMGVTRFNVYAGLAGLWIIRDERERELGLPEGGPYEVPLLLQDRNFGVGADGTLTGRLVHKTDPGVMEAFAPFTVVNGKVWPFLNVEPTTYRFRALNGSNARTFRLVLLRDGAPDHGRITQIGTDAGLLREPVEVPEDGLILASAERADLLVDFSDLPEGTVLTLYNTAGAPFDGAPFPAAEAEDAADLDAMLPFPQVMQFRVGPRVGPGEVKSQPVPHKLATDYVRVRDEELDGAPRRAIALVEREMAGMPNMLTMRELEAVGDGAESTESLVKISDGDDVTRYRSVAAHFEDTTTFFPMLGEYEIWQLINLTEDTHPIHVHLDPFQIVARRPITWSIPDGGIGDRDLTAEVTIGRGPDDGLDHGIDDNERGLKDTVRVNPNEIVEIAVRFHTYAGRFMYHCHILEHEDRDMMRPFVTMPMELMPFMS
ncbi:multicopper oxidase family protein [Gulosibacter molinativorax]|nr:multicopper oxidase domain-containing protein [Gulosibacter molinativorax]QUY62105.1 Phenoxazinone synthase [Gulosibacter molinativorax]